MHEKLFIVISHQGDSNQNHTDTIFQQVEPQKLTRQETTSVGEVGRKENPLILLVGMEVCTATLENGVEVPQNMKNEGYDILHQG